MDPRARADAALARARARGNVVTPDNMTSPMDSSATQQIPRTVVDAVDPRRVDPDSTMVLSSQVAAGQAAPQARPQQPPPPPQPVREPEPELRVAPGPVPTVQQVAGGRPSLAQRLSGGQDQQRPPGLANRLNGD
ncbi:hypothetical protein [Saccharothrix coeruleofusca]|uniref:Uncharacterized protein n=1 Tax=Saccharothrix coeruleofusca TaxID=33919 RepID=A0A918AQ76_9PSEU|nr:hypothetical protein [Saccharothrix coeruleofusca]MBP2339113.1 hypothetical protein [Saccharothrix coeruleofusca]GGP70018.1 hypothetical protein GCM10010185_48760 [Saccharothrix coeruleofusca]